MVAKEQMFPTAIGATNITNYFNKNHKQAQQTKMYSRYFEKQVKNLLDLGATKITNYINKTHKRAQQKQIVLAIF